MNEDHESGGKAGHRQRRTMRTSARVKTLVRLAAGRGTSSSGYSQLPLAHRRRLSYLPGMRAQYMEHESPQVESHCQTMSIHEYLIMSGHRNTSYCIDIVRTLNEASLVARVHIHVQTQNTVPRYASTMKPFENQSIDAILKPR